MKKYIIIITVLTSLITNAQYKEGLIYFNDGTVQEGLIKVRDYGGLKFKENSDSEPISYKNKDIKGYDITQHGKISYKSKKVGEYYVLMKVVRLGKINLYNILRAKPGEGISGGLAIKDMIDYFIEKNGVTVDVGSKLNKSEWHLFEDCPILLEKIKKKKFKKDDIYEIVNFYNISCK